MSMHGVVDSVEISDCCEEVMAIIINVVGKRNKLRTNYDLP
jgi:hypothetical protein